MVLHNGHLQHGISNKQGASPKPLGMRPVILRTMFHSPGIRPDNPATFASDSTKTSAKPGQPGPPPRCHMATRGSLNRIDNLCCDRLRRLRNLDWRDYCCGAHLRRDGCSRIYAQQSTSLWPLFGVYRARRNILCFYGSARTPNPCSKTRLPPYIPVTINNPNPAMESNV